MTAELVEANLRTGGWPDHPVTEREGVLIKLLGVAPYEATWHAMQAFTEARSEATPDEIWLLEHAPVYTLGQAGKREHILRPTEIPILQIDRGGQVTYHGPGQLLAYTLIDLRRRKLGVRELVRKLENSVIALLADFDIESYGKVDAPGVYVRMPGSAVEAKIAALGLRIRNGCAFHGLSLNVDMDLTPFSWINPCGYVGLPVAQLCDFGVRETPAALADKMAARILNQIN